LYKIEDYVILRDQTIGKIEQFELETTAKKYNLWIILNYSKNGISNATKNIKKGDFVWVLGNNDPAEIIETAYEDRFEHYFCKYSDRECWYNERYIIRKLEDWELEALKYNL